MHRLISAQHTYIELAYVYAICICNMYMQVQHITNFLFVMFIWGHEATLQMQNTQYIYLFIHCLSGFPSKHFYMYIYHITKLQVVHCVSKPFHKHLSHPLLCSVMFYSHIEDYSIVNDHFQTLFCKWFSFQTVGNGWTNYNFYIKDSCAHIIDIFSIRMQWIDYHVFVIGAQLLCLLLK